MTAGRIQADYEELAQAASTFHHVSDDVEQLLYQIAQQVGDLQAGGWEGRGADAFYNEMDYEVLPALRRLAAALGEACDAIRYINCTVESAEEDAARRVQADSTTPFVS